MPAPSARKGPEVSLVQDQDIVLADSPADNVTITVIGAAGEDGVKHITDILVSPDICKKSGYLKALLEESDDKTEITLGGNAKLRDEGENKEATLVWLAHLHDLTQERMGELGLWHISLLGVWYAIALWELHQGGKVKESLGTWFTNWYETSMAGADMAIQIARALAFPCYLFDHAVGYARVTKYLAYEHIGHVKERPPRGFNGGKHLHIGERQFVGEYYVSPPLFTLTDLRPSQPRPRRPPQHPSQVSLQPCRSAPPLRNRHLHLLGRHHRALPIRFDQVRSLARRRCPLLFQH